MWFLELLNEFNGLPFNSAGKRICLQYKTPGLDLSGLERSLEKRKDYTLQYSGWRNSMDYSPWGPESWTVDSTSTGDFTVNLMLPEGPQAKKWVN